MCSDLIDKYYNSAKPNRQIKKTNVTEISFPVFADKYLMSIRSLMYPQFKYSVNNTKW
jgi:hypothetical protein